MNGQCRYVYCPRGHGCLGQAKCGSDMTYDLGTLTHTLAPPPPHLLPTHGSCTLESVSQLYFPRGFQIPFNTRYMVFILPSNCSSPFYLKAPCYTLPSLVRLFTIAVVNLKIVPYVRQILRFLSYNGHKSYLMDDNINNV